jgi:hypothetical protein
LHWAAQYGHAAVVALLIGRSADVRMKTNTGKTALHYAKGRAVADLLLKSGTRNMLPAVSNGTCASKVPCFLTGARPLTLDDRGRTASQALRGVPGIVAAGAEAEEERVDQDGEQAEVADDGAAGSKREQRLRKIAECTLKLNAAKDGALQRQAKAAAASEEHDTATQLLKTRTSGRMQRARLAARAAAAKQSCATPPTQRVATDAEAKALWAAANDAGTALDADKSKLAAIAMDQQRQRSPCGQRRPDSILEQRYKDAQQACELRQRISDRAHAAVRKALVIQDNADVSTTEGSLRKLLNLEVSARKEAVQEAQAMAEQARTEAKDAIAVAVATKAKAREALCTIAGDLPPPGTAQRKAKDYKQEQESAYDRAAKSLVQSKARSPITVSTRRAPVSLPCLPCLPCLPTWRMPLVVPLMRCNIILKLCCYVVACMAFTCAD